MTNNSAPVTTHVQHDHNRCNTRDGTIHAINVTPVAATANVAVCTKMFLRLIRLRKFSVDMLNNTTMTSSVSSGVSSRALRLLHVHTSLIVTRAASKLAW